MTITTVIDRTKGGVMKASILALALASSSAIAEPVFLLPLVSGDETMAMTRHSIATLASPLAYEATAGRIPIRNDETGEVRGYAFFVWYRVPAATGNPRPLLISWGGGPTGPAYYQHVINYGPRIETPNGFVDSPDTLLAVADLVFFDPIGTGFSRAARPEFNQEFLSVQGDAASTTEFIRAFRAKFGTEAQPLYLAGQSYGTWRASLVSEQLEKLHIPVAGVILTSGGVPGSGADEAFQDAMFVPQRTAAAFHWRKLAPELMKDRAATLKAASDWAYTVYRPALERRDTLSPAEREAIAASLALYTGLMPQAIDRKTLVVTNDAYRSALLADKGKVLHPLDMRLSIDDPIYQGSAAGVSSYLRGELGYRTDLAYSPLETGYMPAGSPPRRSTTSRWVYDHMKVTPALMQRMKEGAGPPQSLPWLQNAMRSDPRLRVFAAVGRFDSLNRCDGDAIIVKNYPRDLSSRFTLKCYEGGHALDGDVRKQRLEDIRAFIRRGDGG